MTNRPGVALIVVDVQHDFIDGSLAVPQARDILPKVTELIGQDVWDVVVATQDYHPADHVSFARTHGVEPFQERQVPHPYLPGTVSQMMWPVHCVQGTQGAELDPSVAQALEQCAARGTPVHYVKKGQDQRVDGYSAFASNHYLNFTELPQVLYESAVRGRPIGTVVVCGLATDYCVQFTAVDAAKFRFHTVLAKDVMRGVAKDTCDQALDQLGAWGCKVYDTADALRAALGR